MMLVQAANCHQKSEQILSSYIEKQIGIGNEYYEWIN